MPDDKDLELAEQLIKEKKYQDCLPLIEGILSKDDLSDEQTALWKFRKGFCLGEVGQNKSAITAYKTLIAQFKDSDDDEINLCLAKAITSLIYASIIEKQLDKAMTLLVDLNCLANKFDNDPTINLGLAISYFNLITFLINEKKIEEALHLFENLKTLADNFRTDKDINLQLAKSIFNLIVNLINDKKIDKVILLFEYLQTLTCKFQNNKNINLQLAKSIFNLIVYLINDKKIDEALRLFENLKILANKFPNDENINFEFARSICKIIDYWINDKKPDEALRLFENFKILANEFPNNENINFGLAISTTALMDYWMNEKQFEKAETLFDELKNLTNKFPNNKKFIMFFAENAFNLSIAWKTINKTENVKSVFYELIKKFEEYIDVNALPQNWKLEQNEQTIKWKSAHLEDTAEWFYALISIYEKSHDEIKKARTRENSPQKISHFTSIQALYSILGYRNAKEISEKNGDTAQKEKLENILRGYNAIYMNDPSEGRSLVEYSHLCANDQIPDLRKFFKDGENKWVEHDVGQSVFSVSFTKAIDSLPLWRAYGRDGKGICIVIPVSTFGPPDPPAAAPGYNGIAYYRFHINIPDYLKGKECVLQLGVIDDYDNVYVNGVRVGGLGKSFPNTWATNRAYRVPESAIRYGADNVIAVRVEDASGDGGIMHGEQQLEFNAPAVKQSQNLYLSGQSIFEIFGITPYYNEQW